MAEEWRQIPGFPYYEVSNFGEVRSLPRKTTRGGIISQAVVYGYRRVCLHHNGKSTGALVHRLVLQAFVGPAPEGMETAHLDGNRQNNRLENLAWATIRENASHRVLHGTCLHGETCNGAKLTWEAVAEIRALKGIMSTDAMAVKFNIDVSNIRRVLRGDAWKEEFRPAALPPESAPKETGADRG